MPTSTERGNVLEKRAERIIEDAGFEVHRVKRPAVIKTPQGFRSIGSNDLYKCFDLLCVHLDRNPALVQVTTIAKASARKRKITERFPRAPHGIGMEVWAWMPRKAGLPNGGFRVYLYGNTDDGGRFERDRDVVGGSGKRWGRVR